MPKRHWIIKRFSSLAVLMAAYLAAGACLLPFSLHAVEDNSREEESFFVAKKAFEDGFYEVSLGLLERFLKNYPDSKRSADAELLMGECYFHQNKYMEALKKFEELLNQPKAGAIKDAVLYWTAEVHFKGNGFSRAASYYQAIIEGFPKSSYLVHAYYSLGWCLFQEGNYQEALKYFKIVEERYPREPLAQDASLKIIESLYNLKDYQALKEKLGSYAGSRSNNSDRLPYLYFYLAEADYYLNNFSGAIEEYKRGISSTSDAKIQDLSRLGMGWAFLKLKRYDDAEKVFREINGDNLEKKNQEILLLGRAVLLFETKRLLEAKGVYEKLLSESRDPLISVQAYLGEADTLYSLSEYRQAITLYKEALGRNLQSDIPQEYLDKLHYGLAWSLLKEGEFKAAIEEFQKIVQRTEDKTVKVATLCQIGDAYQDSGDYRKAKEAYDTILKDYPDSFYNDYVQYQLGSVLLKISNYDGAIMAFQNIRNNFSNSKIADDATYALALSYFQKEDYNSAKDVLEKFRREFKDTGLKPQAAYLLGTSLYNLGKFGEAIEVFREVARDYGQDKDLAQKAEYEIADCYYQMGNEKEAVARFKVLRSRYPDSKLNPEIIWWLGEYYYRQNDLVMAQRYFLSIINDFSSSNIVADAYYMLGAISQEKGDYENAISNFSKVEQLTKSDLAGQAAIAVADIQAKEDRPEAALASYRQTSVKYPNLAAAVYPKIAEIYHRLGDYDEAVEFYRKSLNVAPLRQLADLQFKIAEAMETRGRFNEAIEEYLKVAYIYHDNAQLVVKALLRVAAIYENQGRKAEAVKIYRRIIAMDVEEAKYAQERINAVKK
ncbi:MAG: tetratricopeptide repeat protein [Candidatus Omnitrophota bacterium]